jgi:hypothetical protein
MANLTRLLLPALLACTATAALAERPMMVDDAGTMDLHGAKVEFGWSRDDKARGWDAVAGFSPIEHLELEVGLERLRDRATAPATHLNGTGFAVKWVPLQQETGLSAGLKLEVGRVRINDHLAPAETERAHSLNGLLTWRTEAEQKLHLNLGREWVKLAGARENANTWGVGFEQPLRENLQLTLETYGAERSRPDKQVGLRWEIVDGLKLSVAAGRGNSRSFAQAGVAWEF